MGMKLGMLGIIFGVLLLVVGLVLSDIIIDQVNKQGGRIGCYDGNDVPVKNASGPGAARAALATNANTAARAAERVAVTNTYSVPIKVSSIYTGANAVGKACGVSTTLVTIPNTGANPAYAAWASPTCATTATCGTVRYSLEVYGADSLNNLFTLVYWIVLVGISLSLVGAGGYGVARGARGSF